MLCIVLHTIILYNNAYQPILSDQKRSRERIEVIKALEEFGLSENFNKVKYWYDGFRYGSRKDIYNPWSITKYLDSNKFGTYWANTSSNTLVGNSCVFLIQSLQIMEVLPMDKNELTKTELWTKRIQDFHESGLSRKEWCQEHQILQSTFGYWIWEQTKEHPDEPVFAKLPSQQEISSDLSAGGVPVTIYLPGSIRIEIGAGCPVGLMASLIHTLNAYA